MHARPDFQLMNTPKAFRAERASWRAVVQLNVVRSIRIILDAMSEAQTHQLAQSSSSPIRTHAPELAHSTSISSLTSRYRHPPLTAEHQVLKLRLAPLVQVEEALIRKLTPVGSSELEATQLRANGSHADRARALDKEVAVPSQFAWKDMLQRMVWRNSSEGEEGELDVSSPISHSSPTAVNGGARAATVAASDRMLATDGPCVA